MRYEDNSQSGSTQDQGPIARDDADQLAAGDRGPASGNVITGVGTESGAIGADAAAGGAKITAVTGASGSDTSLAGGRLQVEGEHGSLSLTPRGDYNYVARANVPENSRDTFTYTLADAAGASDQARLTIEIGKTQAVVDVNARRVVPGPDGVVVLPAGVQLSDVRIVGRDLLVMLPDGTQMLIVDGAVFVPQLVINDVEVPSTNLAALLIDQEPRPASGVPQSGGGNFIQAVGPLDPGTPLGDLLPPTQLQYTPPEFRDVGIAEEDREPVVGANPLSLLDDDARPGGNAGGTGDDLDAANLSGTLSGSGGDGPLSFALSTTGAPTGFTYIAGPSGSLLVQQNGVTVLTVTVNAQTGAYTIAQNAPISHAAGADENNVLLTFGYTVTDRDGDVATGNFQLNVDDDTPLIDVTAGADAAVILTTDDADTRGEARDSASSSANFGGVFNLAVNSVGADGLGTSGPMTFALGTPGGASGLFQGGVAINLFLVGGKVVGSTATSAAGVTSANTVFDVSLTGTNGVVSLTQFSQIDHLGTDPTPTGSPFVDQIARLADNLVTLTASATISDRDGDSASDSVTVQIGDNLRFTDDGPVLTGAQTGAGVTLDETSAVTPAGFPISATSTSAVIVGAGLSFGADGAAASNATSYGLSVVGTGATALRTAIGDFPITLVQTSASVITGTYDGSKVAFTATINANGTLTVSQAVPLEHNVDGSTDAAYNDALSLSGLINASVTVRDFDGDTATASAPIGDRIVFLDDGPSIGIARSDDSNVSLQTDDADTLGAASDSASASFAGLFTVTSAAGADGGSVSAITYALGVGPTPAGLTSGGLAITLFAVDGGRVVGSTALPGQQVTAANTIFDVAVSSNGVVTVTQYGPIDHAASVDPTPGGTPFSDQGYSLPDGAIVLNARATVTDNDGDSASAVQSINIGANIRFTDDGPVARADTDSLAAGAYGPETGNVLSGAGTTSGEVGADSAGADLPAQIVAIAYGEATDSSFDEAGNLVIGGQNGVLTIKADGSYSYTRNAGTPGGVSDVFSYTLRDRDGDTSEATLTIRIGNLPPLVNAPDADAPGTIVYEAALGGTPQGSGEEAAAGPNGDPREATTGSITFNQGDGPAAIRIDGVLVTGVGQLIDTGEGTIRIDTLGAGSLSYTYTLNDNLLVPGASSPDVISVTVTDKDGQVASDTLTISIVDDVPVARLDSDTIASGTFGPATGNVISGAGTTNAAAGADTVGADGATVVGIKAGVDNAAFTGAVGTVIQGTYGKLTLGSDGSYTYTRDPGTAGGVTDRFSYTLRDGDGDTSVTQLEIVIEDAGVTVRIPEAGGQTTTVYERGLAERGGEPAGSGEIADGNGTDNDDMSEAVSGSIGFTSKDGLGSISLGGQALNLSGTYPQTITDTTGQKLVVTGVSYDPVTGLGSIAYTYTLKDNRLVDPDSASFTVVVTDADGDPAPAGNLVISIVDDVPDAKADTDALGVGAYGPETGNVISGAGTTSGNIGLDVVGADNATVVAVSGVTSDSSFDADGNLVVEGLFGILTIKADGSYSYARTPGSDGGVSDVFNYTLRDGDGDEDSATLTISIADDKPELNAPDAGAPGTIVYEAGLPTRNGGEPEGSGEELAAGADGDTREATTGTITYSDGDGPAIVRINNVVVSGTLGQVIDTGEGLLTITSFSPTAVGYSYLLKDNLLSLPESDTIPVSVEDADGDIVNDSLVISIVDDAPDAKLDTDLVAAGTYGPETGNVISGAGTTSGLAGKDVVGADNAAVISVTGFGGSADSSFDVNGNLLVNGQYGALTIKADGSYSYTRNLNTPGGVDDVFTYTLRDGDGDQDSATLTIAIGDTPTSLTIPPAGGATTTVFEKGLAVRNSEQPGSGEIADGNGTNNSDPSELVSGSFTFEAKDGYQSITIGGVTFTSASTFPMGVALVNEPAALIIDGISYNPATGIGTVLYRFVLSDNIAGDQAINGGNTDISITVTVRDLDNDLSNGNLVIRVVDDANDAKADTDALAAGTYGPELGNVITGAGTTSGAAGLDVQGADGSTVVAVTGFGTSADSIFDVNGNLQVNGQYGVLTIKADGSYSYLRNAGTPGGGTETFVYTLRDSDGDSDTATLTITIGNSPPTVNAPDAGAPGTLVFESGLPVRGTETEGSAEQLAAGPDGAPGETTVGVIAYGAPDGPAVVRINGAIVTGTLGQQIDTGEGVMTITAFSPTQIGYSYTLKDNIAGTQSVNGGDTVDSIAVTVTDTDLQVVSDTLVITIRDDAPLANNDVDTIAAGTFGPAIGNVISGDGTVSPLLGQDVPGADGAVVTSVAPLGGTADTSFDVNGNLQVNGLYGVLTIKADGSYSYARNLDTKGGVSDSFTYQLTDGDGDIATAVLRIDIADSPVTFDIPPAGGSTTTVFEAGLPARGTEPEGSGEAAAAGPNGDLREAVSGTIGFSAKDGLETVNLGGVTLTGPYPQTIVNDAGQSLVVTALTYDAATGAGSISYTYVLKDNTLGLNSVNGGDTNASFALVVTDKDLDQSNGNLVITVKDDAPSAASDVDSVGSSNAPATGNILTAIDRLVGGDTNTTDGTADVPGADGAQVVRIASNNVALNIDVTPDAGNFVVVGQFGTLTIGQDGSYSYARSTTAPLTGTDIFTYTIRDGDGDEAVATLTINIADAPVTTNIPPAGGLTTTVYEAALPARGLESEGSGEAAVAGTDGDTREAVTGAIGFTAKDGIGSISLGGVTLSGTTPQTITDTAGQKLVVNSVAFDPVTGIGSISYTYTLKDNTLVDPSSATFALLVTDSDGDTSGGNLVIAIVDDVPTARADTDSLGEGATTGGNVILSTGTDNAPTGFDIAGADGITVVGVRAGSNVATPASGNVATEISGTYGKLTLNADGSYSYKANSNSVTTAQTDVFTYTVRDGDGDLSTTTLTITVNDVTLTPDVEVNSVNEAALATGSNAISTAETTGGQLVVSGATVYTLTSPGAGANGTLQLTSGGAYTYTLTTPFSTNPAANDGAVVSGSNVFNYTATDANGNSVNGTITINIVDDVPTARDDSDTVTEGLGNIADGNLLTGSGGSDTNASDGTSDIAGADGGATVIGARTGTEAAGGSFTAVAAGPGGQLIIGTYGNLLIKADGSYTYTLTTASIPVGVTGESFSYQMRDADGDRDVAQLAISFVQDARTPTVTNPTGTVYEDGLADGVQHGLPSDTTTGSFQVDLKGETGSVTIGGVAVTNGASFNTGEGTLLITGVSTVGTVTTYSYSYTLLAPLTHSGAGEINPISDVVTVNVTDATGDSAAGTITIGIVDDIPVAADDLGYEILEGDTDNAISFDVDTNDVNGADGFGSRVFTSLTGTYGTLTVNGDGTQTYTLSIAGQAAINALAPGATLVDDFSYTLTDVDGDTDPANVRVTLRGTNDPVTITNLTPSLNGGDAVVDEDDLPLGSDTAKESLTTTGNFNVSAPDGIKDLTVGGIQVFINGVFQTNATGTTTLGNSITFTAFDPATGKVSYSYTLLANESHAAGLGENDLFDNMTVVLTDKDTDSATDTLSIRVIDDVVDAVNEPVLTVVEGAAAISGNVITDSEANGGADVPGADGATLIEVDFGAGFVAINSGTAIAGGFFQFVNGDGTYSFNANGAWTFAPANNLSNNVTPYEAGFVYKLRDGDGDTDTAVQVINVTDGANPGPGGNVALTLSEAALDTSATGDLAASTATGTSPTSTAETQIVTAANGLHFTAGSDAITSVAFANSFGGINVAGLQAGYTLSWSINGSGQLAGTLFNGATNLGTAILVQLTGETSGVAAGDIADIGVTATLVGPLEHIYPNATQGPVSISGIQVVASQADGDSNVGTIAISVSDDTPIADLILGAGVIRHDETVGIQSDTDYSGPFADFSWVSNPGDDPHVAGTGPIGIAYSANTNGTVGFTTTASGTNGADGGSAAFSLIVNSSASGLKTTEGLDIFLVQVGARVEGRVGSIASGSPVAFALQLDPIGQVWLAQYLSLQHPTGGTSSPDETVFITNGSLSLQFEVIDGDGDRAVSSVAIGSKIGFDDDGPSAFTPTAVSTTNGNTPAVQGNLNLSIGSDGLGSLVFSPTLSGQPALDQDGRALTVGGQALSYVVNGSTLTAQTSTGVVGFVAQLNQNGTYTFDVQNVIANGTATNFTNLSGTSAGNNATVGIGAGDTSGNVDVLLSASGPNNADKTVNTSSTSIGIGNQSIGPNDSLRIDFVKDVNANLAKPNGFSYGDHVGTSRFIQTVAQVQGNQDQLVSIQVYARDTTNTDATSVDRSPNNGLSDSSGVTITAVRVIDWATTNSTATITLNGVGVATTIGFGVSATRQTDGSVIFSGLQEGDRYEIETGSNEFDSVVVRAVSGTFDLGIFGIGSFNAGTPIIEVLPIIATDADGDSVSSSITATINPVPAASNLRLASSSTTEPVVESSLTSLRTTSANTNIGLMAGLAAGFATTAAAAGTTQSSDFQSYTLDGASAASTGSWTSNAFDTSLDGRFEILRSEIETNSVQGLDALDGHAQRFSNEEIRVEFEQGDTLSDQAMFRLDHGTNLDFGQSVPLPSGGELHIPDAAFFGAVVAQFEPQGDALVGSILADALADGGDGGPGIDRLIDAAILLAEPIQGFGGVEHMIEEAGEQPMPEDAMMFAAAVPAWDAGHFSPLFGAGNTAMDSPTLHPDAVQPAMNG